MVNCKSRCKHTLNVTVAVVVHIAGKRIVNLGPNILEVLRSTLSNCNKECPRYLEKGRFYARFKTVDLDFPIIQETKITLLTKPSLNQLFFLHN